MRIDSLVYRQGNQDDLVQVMQLANISYGEYSSVLDPEDWNKLHSVLNTEKTFTELLTKTSAFVCSDEEKLVGMAFLISSGNPTELFQEDWAYVRMVGVDPGYAGRGIARKLMALCIDKAREMKEKTIALHTSEFMHAARHLYEQMGFTILKEIPPRFGKRYWIYTRNIS